MSTQLAQLQEATIKQHCKVLRMPMMGMQFSSLAEQAVKEKKTHTGYLEALLTAEVEERERNTIDRRIKEAHLPRVKTLEEFDYTQTTMVSAAKMHEHSEGGYIERAEAVESMESQEQAFHPFHRPWKSRKPGVIPTFPQLRRLLYI